MLSITKSICFDRVSFLHHNWLDLASRFRSVCESSLETSVCSTSKRFYNFNKNIPPPAFTLSGIFGKQWMWKWSQADSTFSGNGSGKTKLGMLMSENTAWGRERRRVRMCCWRFRLGGLVCLGWLARGHVYDMFTLRFVCKSRAGGGSLELQLGVVAAPPGSGGRKSNRIICKVGEVIL